MSAQVSNNNNNNNNNNNDNHTVISYDNSASNNTVNTADAVKYSNNDEDKLLPHPFYDHCSAKLKSFLTKDLYPLAKQYVIYYHTHNLYSDSDEKEPYRNIYEARSAMKTSLSKCQTYQKELLSCVSDGHTNDTTTTTTTPATNNSNNNIHSNSDISNATNKDNDNSNNNNDNNNNSNNDNINNTETNDTLPYMVNDFDSIEYDVYAIQMLINFQLYQLGKISIEVEEPHEADGLLTQCFKDLSLRSSLGVVTSLYGHVCKELGILWCQRGDYNKSVEYLLIGKVLYNEYTAATAPLCINEIYSPKSAIQSDQSRKDTWEHCYTLTLYFLAQVYGHLREYDNAALYCRETLTRQLLTAHYSFDALDWSLNAATLAQYYITHEKYAVSKHCLDCGQLIYEQYLAKFSGEKMEKNSELKEKLDRHGSDLARCWIKLIKCIVKDCALIHQAKMSLKHQNCDENINKIKQSITKSEKIMQLSTIINEEDIFKGLDVSTIESLPRIICTDYDSTREIFMFAQDKFNVAYLFYQLDGWVTDHVEIMQDESFLYKKLSEFSPSLEDKCKMHKRRIDMLTELVSKLSKKHYLVKCRQMWFEIAETYMEIVGLKNDIAGGNIQQASQKAMQKYNRLNWGAQKYYKMFDESIETEDTGNYDDKLIRSVLLAKLGTCKTKTNIICDLNNTIKQNRESLDVYIWLLQYFNKNPDQIDICKEEYNLVTYMAKLLPNKLDTLVKSLP